MTDAPATIQPSEAAAGGPRSDEPDAPTTEASADRPLAVTRPILDLHPDDDDQRLFNRDLSWLGFDERVLALAEREDVPLLDRVMFLAIFAGNLDEYFQVRVAGIAEQVAAGVTQPPPDGIPPSEQLTAIRHYVRSLHDRVATLFHDHLVGALETEGIRFSDWATLDDDDRHHLDREFDERVFPVLTPLAVDPSHPFPYISNLSLNLAVVVRAPDTDDVRFARVKVPPILPRFVVMPDGERFVPLERVIAAHLDQLFPGMEIVANHVFRVTRNADMVVEEDEAEDLLEAIESELTRRRFGRVVRLEVEPDMPDDILTLLVSELKVADDDVYVRPGPLDLRGLWALQALERPDLRWAAFPRTTQPRLTAAPGERPDLFATIRDDDLLVQHPYDSFRTSVQRFLEQAARDPRVLAIKQTLYRTSGPDSPVVRALINAAEEGKQVVALVELKARFDEEANIEWARRLEDAGVHVVYGIVGYKTHTKVCLVVRDEGGIVRRYAHIGTGNYNEKTARVYEDLGMLTADPDIGADLSDLFNFLTGYSRQASYRKLLVSPATARPRILELIRREAEADDGTIIMKMNALVDRTIAEALYEASGAGTPIDLICRGICCLRPGVAGMSANIRVRSIVGRFLEHSRIYRFGSVDRGFDFLIGSADMMTRNLDNRVEAVTPVENPRLQDRLQEILQVLLLDDELAWDLRPDGSWARVEPTSGTDAHETLARLAQRRAAGARHLEFAGSEARA